MHTGTTSIGSRCVEHARAFAIVMIFFAFGGCQVVQHAAVDRIGDALSGNGTVFTGDPDPQLVLDALPFGLKTYESLLVAAPNHRGLLLASARGFAAYAFLLQQNADLDETLPYSDRRALDRRISALFLRGRDYALRGLALDDRDIDAELVSHRPLDRVRRREVPFLYWAGAAWSAAIANATDDPERVAELPFAVALMQRALDLDETYDAGAIHEFFATYEGTRPGGDLDAARRHYERALELSHGERASVYLALAEGVCKQRQDAVEFRNLLDRALSVDPNTSAQWRLVNTVARRRAVWLRSQVPDLFIDKE